MQQVGKALIAEAGTKSAENLTLEDIRRTFTHWDRLARSTRYRRATLLRRMLRDLREAHGIPRLWEAVPRVKQAPPRDVVATDEEREKLIAAAKPYLRCLLLLCSDLAIRSGTAAKITPAQYDRQKRTLDFTTKYDARLSLPVTGRLAQLLDSCTGPYDQHTPFVDLLNPRGHVHLNNLRAAFVRLRKRLGINRRITLHDLRRTTAVKTLEITHDIRMVQAVLGHSNLQSTLHYLDHRLTTVPRGLLEEAGYNEPKETIQ